MVYKCGLCGEEHDDLPMDIAFMKPQDYFNVPPAERQKRIKINNDLCSIDERIFLIRGVMPIPVHDSDQDFVWGVWVRVDWKSFRRYIKLWNADGSKERPFRGRLSASIPGYPDTYLLDADVYLRGASERPTIRLRPSDHPLVQEQMNGITMARVHQILETALPHLFKRH